ncbi:MAG: TRAP transporter small permease subunit [Nitrospinota bacterium]
MRVLRACVRFVDALNERVGRGVAWLTLAMVLLTVGDVIARYAFGTGAVAVQELEWHFFAALFLLGAGYTFLQDGHVRVDILYARLSERWKMGIDLFGGLFFLLPTCAVVIWTSSRFVAASWRLLEGSPDPGGLPARYVLKAMIPLGFALLALQGLARVVTIGLRLFGKGGR